MKYSTNYNLKKPEQTEYYNVDDFNDNADTIDSELKKLNDNKANNSALSSVATTGSYNDLIDKPTLFSGNYNDLSNKPTFDTELSATSENCVQNKVITNALGNKLDITNDTSLWNYLHRYDNNYSPADTSNVGWNALGLALTYYTENTINNQPSKYGQLLNIPANLYKESTQFWIEQPGGVLYSRSGNGTKAVNDTAFTKINAFDAYSLGTNGYVKFSNGLIVQWGYYGTIGSETEVTVTLPLAFSTNAYFVGMSTPTRNASSRGIYGAVPNGTTSIKLSNGSSSISNVHWFAIGV